MMLTALITLASALAIGEASPSTQQVVESLRAEVSCERKALDSLPSSPFVDGERPRLKGLPDDTDALLKASRLNVALEGLSSTSSADHRHVPRLHGLGRHGEGRRQGHRPREGMGGSGRSPQGRSPEIPRNRAQGSVDVRSRSSCLHRFRGTRRAPL